MHMDSLLFRNEHTQDRLWIHHNLDQDKAVIEDEIKNEWMMSNTSYLIVLKFGMGNR